MKSNSVSTSNDFSSETTGQILIEVGHSGVDQNLYLKMVWLPIGLRDGSKWSQIVFNF